MILCIETATSICSAALCDASGVIAIRESRDLKSHASLLTVFIKEIFDEAGIKATDLEAVSVSKGPGSYTGLRIGVSVAKGIAYASSIPLIGIETTLSMFFGIKGNTSDNKYEETNVLYCPMLDARRMEVYYAIYDNKGCVVKGIAAEVISEKSFNDIPENKKIMFFGEHICS